jgi:SAM-dependent methyltransferase
VSDFEHARTLVDGVEGWLTDAQAQRLWDEAHAVRPGGRIVEIGSFRGRSTIVLASAAADGVELVAIDPHGGNDRGPQEIGADAARGQADFEAFHTNLERAGVERRVRHVRASSEAALSAVDGEIDVLYVDGAHRYAPARADIEQWGRRVAPGGTMLIHDAFNAVGVMLAQLRVLFFSPRWRYVGRRGSLAAYRRESLSARARVDNGLRQVLGLPYFARNGAVKVLLLAHLRSAAALLGARDGQWPY